MTRVRVVGEHFAFDLADSISSAFEALGQTVVRDARRPPATRAMRALAIRSHFALDWSFRLQVRQALETVDATLVIKGSGLSKSAIASLRAATDGPVLCWLPDDPLDESISNSGAGMISRLSLYDWCYVWSKELQQKLHARSIPTYVLPFASPFLGGFQVSCSSRSRRLAEAIRGRPIFVGTHTKSRKALIEALSPLGPVVFGNGWSQSKHYQLLPEIRGEDLRVAFSSSGVALNPLRRQNRDSHNMRSFEIWGAGGLQLTQRTSDHEAIQNSIPDHMYFYDDVQSCYEMAQSLLARSCLTPPALVPPTYEDRASSMLQDIARSHGSLK